MIKTNKKQRNDHRKKGYKLWDASQTCSNNENPVLYLFDKKIIAIHTKEEFVHQPHQ